MTDDSSVVIRWDEEQLMFHLFCHKMAVSWTKTILSMDDGASELLLALTVRPAAEKILSGGALVDVINTTDRARCDNLGNVSLCILHQVSTSVEIFRHPHSWVSRSMDASAVVRFTTTLCLKKVPTFELSVTLSNLNRFSKFLHCWKAYEICYKIHTTLPTLP